MKSITKPRKRSQEVRFFNRVYKLTFLVTGVNPVAEGRRFERKTNKIIYGDFGGLAKAEEVTRRLNKLDKLDETYGRRLQRFFTVLSWFSYFSGRKRAVKELGPWLKKGDDKMKRINKQLEKIQNGKGKAGTE